MRHARLWRHGKHETLKASVHALGAGLSATMLVYNVMAALERPWARHLKLNAAIYAGALVWEIRQTLRHL